VVCGWFAMPIGKTRQRRSTLTFRKRISSTAVKGLDAALHELKELFPLAKGIGILSEVGRSDRRRY